MRVKGEVAPVTAFTLEPIPKKPGKVMARFYANVAQVEASWQWDEYHLEFESYVGLETDIATNYDTLFRQAQFLDDEESNSDSEFLLELAADHEERICMLELFGEGGI